MRRRTAAPGPCVPAPPFVYGFIHGSCRRPCRYSVGERPVEERNRRKLGLLQIVAGAHDAPLGEKGAEGHARAAAEKTAEIGGGEIEVTGHVRERETVLQMRLDEAFGRGDGILAVRLGRTAPALDRLLDVARARGLEKIVVGAGAHGALDVFKIVVRREHHDAELRQNAAQRGDGLDAVHAGHGDIQKNDVRPLFLRQRKAGQRVEGLPRVNGAGAVARKDEGDHFPLQRLIVDDDDLCHDQNPAFARGMERLMVVPSPGAL